MNVGLYYCAFLLGFLFVGEMMTGYHAVSPEGGFKYGNYSGCYKAMCIDNRQSMSPDYEASQISNYTPDNCTGLCYKIGYPWAGIFNETECVCSCLNCNEAARVKNGYCGIPCSGDVQQFCGGSSWTSIYQINLDANLSADCDDGSLESGKWTWNVIWITMGGVIVIITISITVLTMIWRGFNIVGRRNWEDRRQTPVTPRPYSDYIFRRRRSSKRSQYRGPERNRAAAADLPTPPPSASATIDLRPPVAAPRTVASVRVAAPCTNTSVRVAAPRTKSSERVAEPSTKASVRVAAPSTYAGVRVAVPRTKASVSAALYDEIAQDVDDCKFQDEQKLDAPTLPTRLYI